MNNKLEILTKIFNEPKKLDKLYNNMPFDIETFLDTLPDNTELINVSCKKLTYHVKN